MTTKAMNTTIAAIETILSTEGWVLVDGMVERANSKIKLMRYVMRNRKKLNDVMGYEVSEAAIESVCKTMLSDTGYTWESVSSTDVAGAYANHFAMAHKLLINPDDANVTLFNIAQFVTRSRSCMTPDPSYGGRVGDLPMDCALRAYYLLTNFREDGVQEFFSCVNGSGKKADGSKITVACNVWVRTEKATGAKTTFRFLTWVYGEKLLVDKVYLSGSRADLEQFQSEFASVHSNACFREHNHLIDSDDSDGVAFRPHGGHRSFYPAFNVDVTNCNYRFPYLDSFRYFDELEHCSTFTTEPSDDTRYSADSCSGGYNEFDGVGESCGCCGDRISSDDIMHVDNTDISSSGIVCETCYCDEIGHCSSCDGQIAINHEQFVTVGYENHCDHCFTISN